jgi:hypothetical protein
VGRPARTPASSTGCFEYENEYTQPGGFVGRVAGRVLVAGAAEREANRSLERLKAFVERDGT